MADKEKIQGTVHISDPTPPTDRKKVIRGTVSSLKDINEPLPPTTDENGQKVMRGRLLTAKEQNRRRMARIRRTQKKLDELVEEFGRDHLPRVPGEIVTTEKRAYRIIGYTYNKKKGLVTYNSVPVKTQKED